MAAKTIWDLVKLALPEDVHPRELLALSPQKWWAEKPYLATAHALRKSPRINWEAYLARYDDVRQSGMDPCLHFLKHGIFEGRKLISWHKLKEPEKPGRPLVSIVIINYNNAHLLEKCIGSVVNQTLRDIEIIIVDDCSTDESLDIIRGFAATDERIKVLVNPENSLTLITRKRGVEVATGRYLMFLDSDDFLAPNACEVAAREIEKGYDAVKFGVNIINNQNANEKIIRNFDAFCNGGESRIYHYDEILTEVFRDRNMSWHLWAYIYLREIVASGFDELGNERFTGPDDLLETLAILSHSRHLLRIPAKLIFYSFGQGITVTNNKNKVLKYSKSICITTRYILDYAIDHSLNIGIRKLYSELCENIIKKYIPIAGSDGVAGSFAELTSILGLNETLKILIERYGNEQEKIAALVKPLSNRAREIHHIGIFYPVLGHGGVEVIIRILCTLFEQDRYKFTVFTEEMSSHDLIFPEDIDIRYISPPCREEAALPQRMQSFEETVKACGIDMMLYAGTYMPSVLWDLMVLRHHDIPVIFFYHFNSALSFMQKDAVHRAREEKIFSLADAVTCLSVAEEFYLRNHGVNAIYLPNPVRQTPKWTPQCASPKIAVLGRLGDPVKQIGHSLRVMREVVERAPWIKMLLIGDFYTDEQRREYTQIVKEFGLEQHVSLTGWTDDPDYFLSQCGVLLSVSLWEAFPMNIAEALAMGIPCVAYKLAIEQARDNPAVISVPQGDFVAAAEEIVALLTDSERWRALSQAAIENSRQYSPENFANRLREIFTNFCRFSALRSYQPHEYETIAKCASFYSGRQIPDTWVGQAV